MKLTPIDYRSRLNAATEQLAEGALLLLSQPTAYRNANNEHSYRQESFLYYLTGFDEPDSALLILANEPEGKRNILFLRDKDALAELWSGKRLGIAAATKELSIDAAFPIESLWEKLPLLVRKARRLYYHLGRDQNSDVKVIKALHEAKRGRGRENVNLLSIHDANFISGALRLRKSPEEIERMRQAAAITRQTFAKIYEAVRPGMNEREVNGLIVGEFLRLGSEMESYGSIVAGGVNATCLHYRSNNQPLVDGQLLLIDAGAQFQYYASDVTRTFPIGRKFTGEQRAIYEIVLDAQLIGIKAGTVGSSLNKIHQAALDRLIDGLIELKFLTGSRDEIKERQTFKRFYPHGTSHWIGLDTHDVGDYMEDGDFMPLKPGMYFSVEPGLYIDANDDTVPEGFRGIGVRVEDDVLVTERGPDVLTTGIAKAVADLENRY